MDDYSFDCTDMDYTLDAFKGDDRVEESNKDDSLVVGDIYSLEIHLYPLALARNLEVYFLNLSNPISYI